MTLFLSVHLMLPFFDELLRKVSDIFRGVCSQFPDGETRFAFLSNFEVPSASEFLTLTE